jgi:WD40 repeat protein
MEAINGQIELAWSPDSKRIACNGPDGKTIKIMSLADGSTVDLAPDLVNARIWHLDWSHDGQRLVFAGRQGTTDSEFWMMENFLSAVSEKDSKWRGAHDESQAERNSGARAVLAQLSDGP